MPPQLIIGVQDAQKMNVFLGFIFNEQTLNKWLKDEWSPTHPHHPKPKPKLNQKNPKPLPLQTPQTPNPSHPTPTPPQTTRS